MSTIENMEFSSEVLSQFNERGISQEEVQRQIQNFQTGFPFMEILKAATISDGILKLSDEEIQSHVKHF